MAFLRTFKLSLSLCAKVENDTMQTTMIVNANLHVEQRDLIDTCLIHLKQNAFGKSYSYLEIKGLPNSSSHISYLLRILMIIKNFAQCDDSSFDLFVADFLILKRLYVLPPFISIFS